MQNQTKPEPLGASMAKLVLIICVIFSLGVALGVAGYLIANKLKITLPVMPPGQEKVTITIDKTEYVEGEIVELQLDNNLTEPLFLDGCNQYDLEKKENGQWTKELPLKCGWEGNAVIVNSNEKTNFILDTYKTGIFRVVVMYFQGCRMNKPISKAGCKTENTIYSNEFTIKEKDETADWKTYRNEEYGFEVKYPEDWTVNNTGSDTISLDNYNFCSKKGRDGCFRISIFLVQDENSSSYQKEFEVMEKIITKKKDNKLFVFSITVEEKAKTILDKAMPTFKFIEIESIDNWKTYRNEKYNYEINYPETYSIFQGLKQESDETIPASLESKKIYITNNLSLFFCCEPVYLSIEILDNSVSENNFEEWVYNKEMINEDNGYRIIKKEYFDFAGERAYRTYNECGIDSPKNIIILNHGSNTYYIKYDHQSCFPKVEDILSTFKFIEK